VSNFNCQFFAIYGHHSFFYRFLIYGNRQTIDDAINFSVLGYSTLLWYMLSEDSTWHGVAYYPSL